MFLCEFLKRLEKFRPIFVEFFRASAMLLALAPSFSPAGENLSTIASIRLCLSSCYLISGKWMNVLFIF